MVRQYDESEIPSVYDLHEVPAARDEPGLTQKVFRGIDSMVGFSVIGPERDPSPHTHPWEQINLLAEGDLGFYVGGKTVSLSEYDVLEIPPGVEHTAEPISDDPAVLLAFWPLREDRLSATEYQSEFDATN